VSDETVPQRVVLSGSRSYPHLHWVRSVVRMLHAKGATLYVGYDPETRLPKGVDEAAYETAVALGMPYQCFPPRWRVNGRTNKGAGLQRNMQMIAEGDQVIAFWDVVKQSRGTAHVIVNAHKWGKLFRVYVSSPDPAFNDPEVILKLAYKVRGESYIPAVDAGVAELKDVVQEPLPMMSYETKAPDDPSDGSSR
jgi:hypothetical protein